MIRQSPADSGSIENPRVSLHGGPKGFDALPWTLLAPEESPILFSAAEITSIAPSGPSSYGIFRLISTDGDQGYPGTLLVEALIALVEPGDQQHARQQAEAGEKPVSYDLGRIILVYRAKLEGGEKKVVTPINLTQVRCRVVILCGDPDTLLKHWGFNLDASLKGDADSLSVKNHLLTIKVMTQSLQL